MSEIKDLTKLLTVLEGGNAEINIAQMAELVGDISDLVYAYPITMFKILYVNGKRRKKAK